MKLKRVEAPCGCTFELTDKTVREERWHCPTCNEFLEESEEPVKIYECSHDGCGEKYNEEDGSQSCCPACNRPFNRKINNLGHASCNEEEECEKAVAVQCPICEEWCREDELTEGAGPVTTKASKKQKQQDAEEKRKAEQAEEIVELKRRLAIFTRKYGVEITSPPHDGLCCSATAKCFTVMVGVGYCVTVRTWTRAEAEKLAAMMKETSVERHHADLTVKIREDSVSLGLFNLPEYK